MWLPNHSAGAACFSVFTELLSRVRLLLNFRGLYFTRFLFSCQGYLSDIFEGVFRFRVALFVRQDGALIYNERRSLVGSWLFSCDRFSLSSEIGFFVPSCTILPQFEGVSRDSSDFFSFTFSSFSARGRTLFLLAD